MRIIPQFDTKVFPPKVTLFVHGAPHYRQSKEVFDVYRKKLNEAWTNAGFGLNISTPVDMDVLFIDPSSPDIFNVGLALTRALDGKTKKGILQDDGLISRATIAKFYPCEPNKSEQRIP